MFLSVLSSLAALGTATAASAPLHQAELTHADGTYNATYRTQSIVHVREIAPVALMRQVNALCRWQADLVVNRAVGTTTGAPVAAMGKAIHRFAPVGGAEAGRCQDVRGRIDAQIARRLQAVQGEAVAVAQRDRAVLASELDGLRALYSQGG